MGEPVKMGWKIEDWGGGRQSPGVPAGVVPPSGDSYFTICLTQSTQKHPDASHPSPDARARSRTQVPARWMTGGSSQHNPTPPAPLAHTDSSRHLRQLPLSQRKDSDRLDTINS